MARPKITQALTPSILDRLLDFDPSRKVEAVSSRNQVIKELRESVRRDLENLLNTRRRCNDEMGRWELLEFTALNYGIPDATGINIGSDDAKAEFARVIEKIIMKYEPRFKSVSISVSNDASALDRTFRFRIDALLRVEPAVKPIVFDSSLEPVTRSFHVRDVEGE
ncbi:MAG: type VI secretion system baseplate subunit TssE [Gammaproteobacteria bacterium]|nr:type VI secretion system baseplate subunit TssE [Gammaproteobacteria bacterium]